MIRRLLCFLVVGTGLLAACSSDPAGTDGTTPPPGTTRPPSQLSFVEFGPTAPPLASTSVSFWAKRGEDASAEICYLTQDDDDDCEEFVEFELEENSLLARPDGTPFAVGDSVLITIRIVDPRRLEVELLPAGLRFNPQEPAELSFDFGFADDDLDDDGDVDDRDQALNRQLAVWRLPSGAAAWTKLATIRFDDLEELEADLTGFSRFAIAF
jgi:hypothetical protein